jgi:hypothetical protein
MEMTMYDGIEVQANCTICGSPLDYVTAETATTDSEALAEAYNPLTYDTSLTYQQNVESGAAGVVHAMCYEDADWELS